MLLDFVVQQELRMMKSEISHQCRKNYELEKELRRYDSKIAHLIHHKISLEVCCLIARAPIAKCATILCISSDRSLRSTVWMNQPWRCCQVREHCCVCWCVGELFFFTHL